MFSDVLSGMFSNIFAGILCETSSNVLSNIAFGALSGIVWYIFQDFFLACLLAVKIERMKKRKISLKV